MMPIQIIAQLDTIESIVYSHKDEKGNWLKYKKYQYSYDKNMTEEILSNWEMNAWNKSQMRIRETTPESDSIVVKTYKNQNSNWVLFKAEIGLFLKDSAERSYYEIETFYSDERLKKRKKRREKKLGRKISGSRFVTKGESYNLLRLLPTTQVGDIIRHSNYRIKNGKKRKEFSPLGCGFSKPITYEVLYDNLERIEQFKSSEAIITINYRN